MSHNYTPQCESLYTNLQRTKKTLSVLAESHRALAEWNRSLLEENEAKDETIKAKDKTIQSFEQKVLEQQQEIDDLRRERDWQPNHWDNDGSSNADCRAREYAADRLGI
ncbi:hypothetical protein [Microcoleus asticus]|uniref:Uncharacterized protein n=1 Tax=Microcoleus asticus IPMA8 TaxID=2563858 RepID=A0ABX2D4P3_9CYAN|nr:hypothetical protein [Microcoleus asticus]NQE36902.1 hypothetical protein [Microcoleus asticus IPMA8]